MESGERSEDTNLLNTQDHLKDEGARQRREKNSQIYPREKVSADPVMTDKPARIGIVGNRYIVLTLI